MKLKWAALAAAGMAPAGAQAQWQAVVEVPRIEVAEYHRPYIALWVEKPDGTFVTNLAVWYDVRPRKGQGEEGTSWLKDLRAWWRKSGRELTMPVDGVSGPTRPPGRHEAVVNPGALPAGEYVLAAEAARELGGREVVRAPFRWDGRSISGGQARGKSELGQVEIRTGKGR